MLGMQSTRSSETHQKLISLFRPFERENLRVNDRVDIILPQCQQPCPPSWSRPHVGTEGDAHLVEALKHALRNILATEESDDSNHTLGFDGFQALLETLVINGIPLLELSLKL